MLRALGRAILLLLFAGLLAVVVIGLLNTLVGRTGPTGALSGDVKQRFPDIDSAREYLARALQPRSEAGPPTLDSPSPSATPDTNRASEAGHSPRPAFDVCRRPGGREITVAPGVTAYSWVDDTGVVNFGDEAPDDAVVRTIQLDAGSTDFVLNLVADEGLVPQVLHGQLNAGAKRIYDQWYEWLGPGRVHQSEINVRLVGNQAVFRSLWGETAGESYPDGFYRMTDNTDYIDYDPSTMSDTRLFGLAFHEISHLIASWQVGSLPPWFSEGLAEYFETMTVARSSAGFMPAARWRERASEHPLLALGDLIALDRTDWWQRDVSSRYLTAGALFAFLHSDDAGRRTLQGMALEASDKRCEGAGDKGEAALATYPGGVPGLNRSFRKWVGEG